MKHRGAPMEEFLGDLVKESAERSFHKKFFRKSNKFLRKYFFFALSTDKLLTDHEFLLNFFKKNLAQISYENPWVYPVVLQSISLEVRTIFSFRTFLTTQAIISPVMFSLILYDFFQNFSVFQSFWPRISLRIPLEITSQIPPIFFSIKNYLKNVQRNYLRIQGHFWDIIGEIHEKILKASL